MPDNRSDDAPMRPLSAHQPPVSLCQSEALQEGGAAVPFDVMFESEAQRAFAIRYEGRAHAYLNRCAHVPVEMDFQPDQFFDDSGQWLLCASHGAAYAPDTGACAGGPCQGGLVRVGMSERDGQVFWHPDALLQPVSF